MSINFKYFMNNLNESAFEEFQPLRNKINISLEVCEKVLDDFSNLIFAEVNIISYKINIYITIFIENIKGMRRRLSKNLPKNF